MHNATFFVAQPQYDWLAAKLPEPVSKTKPTIPNSELLSGVFVRPQDRLPLAGYTEFALRRFNFWRQRGALKLVWQGKLDLSLGHLDGSFVQPPKYQGTGFSNKHHWNGTNKAVVWALRAVRQKKNVLVIVIARPSIT